MRLISAIFVAVFLICGCAAPPRSESAMEEALSYLTSKESAGRLPGTEGNEICAAYIANCFSEAKLDYFQGSSYQIFYEQIIFSPDEQTRTMEVTWADGTSKQYVFGKDIPVNLDDTGDASYLIKAGEDEHSLLIVPVSNEETLMIKQSAGADASFGGGRINVPPKLFQQIADNGVSVKLSGTLNTRTANVPNVVGVRKGLEGKNAIVIGAHFDHIGWYGDTVFPGALDNASGVAVLLQILKNVTEQNPSFDNDLIFCGFNGEDSNLAGSLAFVPLLKNYENVNLINLDSCCGKTTGPLLIDGENREFVKEISQYFEENGFEILSEGEYGTSDHIAFEGMGYPSVCIGDKNCYDIIHTTEYTSYRLDLENMEQLADMISGYIEKLDKKMFGKKKIYRLQKNQGDNRAALYRDAYEYGKKLLTEYQVGFHQKIEYPFEGYYFYMPGAWPLTSTEEVERKYPDIHLEEAIGDYQFQSFLVTVPSPIMLDDVPYEDLPRKPRVTEEIRYREGSELGMFLINVTDGKNSYQITKYNDKGSSNHRDLESIGYVPWEKHPESYVRASRSESGESGYEALMVFPANSSGFYYKAEANEDGKSLDNEEAELLYQAVAFDLDLQLKGTGQ